jgi:hypothetical protein
VSPQEAGTAEGADTDARDGAQEPQPEPEMPALVAAVPGKPVDSV